uniref:Uncharacterized protein n=1 Tax=Sphaerodactylus townsendi TaxID=933632 RepID=A0ACB8GE64_9SAUR
MDLAHLTAGAPTSESAVEMAGRSPRPSAKVDSVGGALGGYRAAQAGWVGPEGGRRWRRRWQRRSIEPADLAGSARAAGGKGSCARAAGRRPQLQRAPAGARTDAQTGQKEEPTPGRGRGGEGELYGSDKLRKRKKVEGCALLRPVLHLFSLPELVPETELKTE